MALTKYASFEVNSILEVKGSAERQVSPTFSRVAAFEDYRTEDGYLYARIRAISSRVNKNHDGWPSVELAGGQEAFDHHTANTDGGFTVNASKDAQYGFSTFIGKPIFVDHHNSDPSRARGVIVDSKLHVEDYKTAAKKDSYYASAPSNHCPPTWVELLLEVDARSFPKLAKAIIDGSRNAKRGIDGFSMGCDVERSECNICKNSATTPEEFCKHVMMKGASFDHYDEMGHRTSKKAYEDCYGIKFFEISAVFDPADETALIREVRSNVKEAFMNKASGMMPEEGQFYEVQDMVGMSGFSGDNVDHVGGLIEISEADPGIGFMVYCHDDGISTFVDVDEFKSALAEGRAKLVSEQNSISKETSMNKTASEGLGSAHESGNPKPQSEKARAPESIDTLRKEKICEVCGSDMEGPQCDVCGWESEPEGFDNPDLEKAKEKKKKREEERENDKHDKHDKHDDHDDHKHDEEDAISSLESSDTKKSLTVAHVTDMDQNNLDSKVAQINKIERPILPVGSPATNEPKDHVVKDQDKPNTSSIRTASDFVAAASYDKRNNMEQQHTADATSTAPAIAKPEYKTEVVDVGGIGDSSNEAASAADTQVSVSDIGGVSGVGTGDEKTVEVTQGDEHSKNIDVIHTDTFSGDKGDSLGQHPPVSSDPFPASAEGVRASSWVVSDVRGAEPADAMGKPDYRTDVSHGDAHSTTTQDSGPTATFPDGNSAVTRQADPVTPTSSDADQNSTENHPTGVESNDYAFGKDSSAHIMAAFKLADMEIELGLLDSDRKYDRVAELENAAPSVVEASLNYADRVRTAGLKKAVKTAKRLPSMAKGAAVTVSKSQNEEPEDSALFM